MIYFPMSSGTLYIYEVKGEQETDDRDIFENLEIHSSSWPVSLPNRTVGDV